MTPTPENRAFAWNIRAERETHVLLAMQKVEGSNPFSRFGGPGSTEPHMASWGDWI
jgi:hypothetical protein